MFTSILSNTLASTDAYKLLIGSIIPRPIAWVSTLSNQGVGNIAPFSFFNAVGSNPPSIMFSIARSATKGNKDTLQNIISTQEFVINMVTEDLAAIMNETAIEHPHGVNEYELNNIPMIASQLVKPMRVAGSPIHLECKLLQTVTVGPQEQTGSAHVIIGEIIAFHFHDSYLKEGKVDPVLYKPISRLQGHNYGRIDSSFEIKRK